MPNLRAQISMPSDTGLPEDVVTNTIYVGAEGMTATEIHTAAQPNVAGLCEDLAAIIPSSLVQSPFIVKWYDMADVEPRPVLFTDSVPVTLSVTGTGIPRQIAACLSFRAPFVAGGIRARRRGRIYVGPLISPAVQVTGGRTQLEASFATAIADAGETFAEACIADGVSWRIHSPTSPSSDDKFVEVSNVWVDDALDTQRRRRSGPTTRTERGPFF